MPVDPLRRSACEETRSSYIRTSLVGASLLLGMIHTELLTREHQRLKREGSDCGGMSYDVGVFPAARHHDFEHLHDLQLVKHHFHIPIYSG